MYIDINRHIMSIIVTEQILCACQGSRAQRERNAQHAAHADWLCLL